MSKELLQQALEALEHLQARTGNFDRFRTINKLRAAIDAPTPPVWMPIETAPRDRAVLVHPATWSERTASIANWDADKYAKKPRPYWSRDDDMGKVTISRERTPTHWMPLPKAP